MLSFKKIAFIASFTLGTGFVATSVHAGGFLAGIANVFVPGSGPVLDGIHDAMGDPLNGLVGQQQLAGAMRAVQPVQPVPQLQYGYVCYTFNGARFTGPPNPLGSPCMTPMGPGRVGM